MKDWLTGKTENIQETLRRPGAIIADSDVLYHYTSATALQTILGNGKLRLSQREFMNDIREASYSRDLMRQSFVRTYSSQSDAEVAFEEFEERMIPSWQKKYVFSLSYAPDSVHLWSYYSYEDGYALGFRLSDLKRLFQECKMPFEAGTVVYDVILQEQLLDQIIEVIREREINPDKFTDSQFEESSKFDVMLALIHSLIKQPQHDCEKEYRFVVHSSESPKEFHTKRGLFVPYIEIAGDEHRIPICSITMGPRVTDQMAEHGLKQLLQFHNYENVKLKHSQIGVR